LAPAQEYFIDDTTPFTEVSSQPPSMYITDFIR
jgi:hypothetical protein